MPSELADVGLAAIKKVTDLWKAGRADSLIEFTRPTRVEPIVLIDADVLHMDAMPDVMQSLLAMFSGYYLQAVAVMATVGNVEVVKQLDKLNPNRDAVGNMVDSASWMLAAESYKDRLPKPSKQFALEAGLIGPDDKSVASIKDLANLSVGKLLSVEISDGAGHKAKIPVGVRLIASSTPTQTLIHILTLNGQDKTWKERIHGWLSGRLSFVKDLLLCNDLIQAHRKNLMADKDGAYTTISKRASGNAISTIVTGTPSVATASNMVVMSERTAKELELSMTGRLSDFRAREKLLADTTVMILAVIDPQFDRVTFYHRSIPQATELGVRDLRAANKGSGPSVEDILKAYSMGQSPSL